jgi:hypothetical protein
VGHSHFYLSQQVHYCSGVCFFPRAIFRSFYDQSLSFHLVHKRPARPVVPPVVVKGSPLRVLGNIATILAGFGVTAAAIEVLR